MTARNRFSTKGPEFLIELVDIAAHLLATRGGLSPEKSEDLATELADLVADKSGGFTVYIPKGKWNGKTLRWHELQKRDLQIVREYDGRNRLELCERYGISASRFYQVVCADRRRRAEEREFDAPKSRQ